MTPTTIRIVSYNVLSNHLCEPEHFVQCKPEFLDPSYRFARLKEKLLVEIKKNAVICLQEVSIEWTGYLHSFFLEQGYVMITALYGKHFNGYMGVATAIPLNVYDVCDVHIDTLSDYIPSKFLSTPNDQWQEPPQTLGILISDVFRAVGKLLMLPMGMLTNGSTGTRSAPAGGAIPIENHYDTARARVNQMITVILRSKKSTGITSTAYVVSNYHMPCMFKKPKVMLLHTALVGLVARKWAIQTQCCTSDTPLPLLVAGDFNITPSGLMYRCMTGDWTAEPDEFPADFDQLLSLFYTEHNLHHDGSDRDVTVIKTDLSMNSMYKIVNGNEPDYTNHAVVKSWWEGGPPVSTFIDTLDFIFVSRSGWQNARDLIPLTHRDELALLEDPECRGPFPNRVEPSDHVMIGGSIDIV